MALRNRQAGLLEAPPAMVRDIASWAKATCVAQAIAGYLGELPSALDTVKSITKDIATVGRRSKALRETMLVGTPKDVARQFRPLFDLVDSFYGMNVRNPRMDQVVYLTEGSKQRMIAEVDSWVSQVLVELDKVRLKKVEAVSQLKKSIEELESEVDHAVTGGSLSKMFPLDLSGWRYDTPGLRKALGGLSTWGEIRVDLSPKLPPGVGGSWQPATKTLTLPLHVAGRHQILDSVRHELQHMAQSLMQTALQNKTFGLPSHNTRTPGFNQAQNRDYLKMNAPGAQGLDAAQFHRLDDREFYPVLTDLIEKIKDWVVREKPDVPEQKRKILELLGVAGDPKKQREELLTWKRHAPGKWKKAVKEIYRAFPFLGSGAMIARVASSWELRPSPPKP